LGFVDQLLVELEEVVARDESLSSAAVSYFRERTYADI
jgi:hypothetical protein